MLKPRLKDSSSTALLMLSALLLAPGLLILSPDGRLFFLVLAGFVSAIVLIAGLSRKKRFVAAIGLLLVVVLAIPTWSEYRVHSDAWGKYILRQQEQKSEQGSGGLR
jgi:membrane protein implicated in regulation of membrane protease activity